MGRSVFVLVIVMTTAACGAFLGSSGDDDPGPGGSATTDTSEGDAGGDARSAEGGAGGEPGEGGSPFDGDVKGTWICIVASDNTVGPFPSEKACQDDQGTKACSNASSDDSCIRGEPDKFFCGPCTPLTTSAGEYHYAGKTCTCG